MLPPHLTPSVTVTDGWAESHYLGVEMPEQEESVLVKQLVCGRADGASSSAQFIRADFLCFRSPAAFLFVSCVGRLYCYHAFE